MRKVLIISYHAIPLNVVASYRSQGLIENLPISGYRPTLITHHHDLEKKTIEIHDFQHHDEIRLVDPEDKPYPKGALVRKLKILYRWFKGYFDSLEKHHLSYLAFRNFLDKHLQETSYDLVMGIFSPHHHLKLCYEINRKFNIPYVLDFRDLWKNKIMDINYKVGRKEQLQDSLIKFYWRKWISNAEFLTTVSAPWGNKLEELFKKKTYVIKHGYDHVSKKEQVAKAFYITYAGSTSGTQQLEAIAKSIGEFIKGRDHPIKFQVRFFGSIRGAYRSKNDDSGFLSNPEVILRKWIPEDYLKVTRRIPKEKVLKAYEESQILLLPSYVGVVGTYSGKLFEYIGARRNILVYPPDHGVIDELLQETQAGVSLNTQQEVTRYIDEKYSEWEKEGYVTYHGIEKTLKENSRAHQVSRFAVLLNDYLDH